MSKLVYKYGLMVFIMILGLVGVFAELGLGSSTIRPGIGFGFEEDWLVGKEAHPINNTLAIPIIAMI